MKCAYFDLGCKIEVLRRNYTDHLKEESFSHSILFIEGQKVKNREIDELKVDIQTLKRDYDVEIKSMYLELSKLKDEMSHIRTKSRGKPDYFAKQVIYPGDREFSLAPPQKKDEQRYQQNSNNQSVRSSTIFDYSSGLPLFNGAP